MRLEASVRAFSTQLSSLDSVALTWPRELMNQRDESGQSLAVDAVALTDKLK